jgi:acetyl esterase/lipase
MRDPLSRLVIAALLALFASSGARAQATVNLWPGVAPGSEHWNWEEQTFHVPLNGAPETIIQDVVTPTLTVFLPARGKATGTGVIVAPGGACIALAMDSEGVNIARWLQARGVAAFVLKYRLKHKQVEGMPKGLREDDACRWGIADGAQAVRLVRQHAHEWGIAPHRLGFIGFSAGGMIASEVMVRKDAAAQPDFVALIYGAPFESMPAVPSNLPPVFMAWAQDDTTAGYAMVRFYKALMDAHDAPEAHIYAAGGHGFASRVQGTPSDRWREELWWWMQAKGFAPKGQTQLQGGPQ